MSKILKTVGKIAGVVGAVALVATGVGIPVVAGISMATLATVAGAVSLGASLLAGRPKAPQVPNEGIDRLQSTVNPRTNRKFVLGQTAMATDIMDYEYSSNQDYCHQFIVVAAHKVAGIDELWLNEKLAWTATGGAQGEYVGYLDVTPVLEGSSGNAINIGPRMGSTRRYTGCAYLYIRYKLTGNSKKTESPFAQSIPTKMVIRGRGAYTYDPRLDSTVPGGSGSHRADDQTTWTWNASASRNPALQLLWFLLGWRINGKVSVGCGLDGSRIDLESFITAANLCDETVTLAAGGTEPRYRGDGIGSTGIGPIQLIDNLKAAMNADLDDVDGKLRVAVFHNDLADPVADFGDDDMVGDFTWNQTPDLSDMFNVVRGTYVDPSDKVLYQMVDYPEVRLASRDSIDRLDSFDLAFVQSPSQAQRLAKQRLQRQQYGGTFETTFNARGWLIEKNSIIRLSCSVLGWTNKLFRVAQMEHRIDGTCPVVLREENAAIYAWDASEAPAVEPADPSEYDYTLNPFYQGIEDASTPAWSDIVDDGGKPMDNADVTANSQITIIPPPTTVLIERTWDQQIKEGQLPREAFAIVKRGDTDISRDDNVSYSLDNAGGAIGNVTVNNVDDDPDKGLITIDNISSSGTSRLIISAYGNDFGPYEIDIKIQDDPPPAPNAVGGGTDSSFPSVSTTSFVPLTGTSPSDQALDVTVTSTSDTVKISASLSVRVSSVDPDATQTFECQGQYFSGSTWSDMSGGISSASAFKESDPVTGRAKFIDGSISASWTVTGLSAGIYPIRLVGRKTSPTGNDIRLTGQAVSSLS